MLADKDIPLTFGDFAIDRADERLIGPHGPVKLGNKAYRVLLLLAGQQGRLLTKDALFSSVWDGTIVGESALTSVIKELRRALGDESRTPRYIESVYGRGYRFISPVVEAPLNGGPHSLAVPAAVEEVPRSGRGDPPLLYVPPFELLAASDKHSPLAAVLREEVLFALSRFRDIRLVSDQAAAAPPTRAYGDRDYQLSLKLAQDGESVRAFTRLCRLASGAIIWADTIELTGGNLGPDVDRLVRRIAAAALPRMQDDLLGNLPAQPHDVYDLYFLTKLKMSSQISHADARGVAAIWERIIAEHPNFAPAYPPLARLYNTDYCYSGLGSTGEADRRRAYDLAHKAFALDSTDSHSHTMKGWSHLWAGEWALARRHLDEALQLNPYNERRLVEVATAFMYLDDLAGAADLLKRCCDLTPFVTDAPYEEQGLLYLLNGEYEQAAEHLSLARRSNPDDRAGTRPTLISELYGVWAAAGANASDLPMRAAHWRDLVAKLWCGAEPLTDERLKQWVLYHSPFKNPERRGWLLGLLEDALSATRSDHAGTPPHGASLTR